MLNRASVMGRPIVYYVKKIRSYVQNSDHGSHEVGIALDFQNLKVGSQDFHLFCRILQEFSFNINKIETSLRNVIK